VLLLTVDPVSRRHLPVQMTLLEAVAHFGLPDPESLQQAEDAAQQQLEKQRLVLGAALSKVGNTLQEAEVIQDSSAGTSVCCG
jgi:hypothetical protein